MVSCQHCGHPSARHTEIGCHVPVRTPCGPHCEESCGCAACDCPGFQPQVLTPKRSPDDPCRHCQHGRADHLFDRGACDVRSPGQVHGPSYCLCPSYEARPAPRHGERCQGCQHLRSEHRQNNGYCDVIVDRAVSEQGGITEIHCDCQGFQTQMPPVASQAPAQPRQSAVQDESTTRQFYALLTDEALNAMIRALTSERIALRLLMTALMRQAPDVLGANDDDVELAIAAYTDWSGRVQQAATMQLDLGERWELAFAAARERQTHS